jgi:O-antigen/teichoic acid export membrane protein
MSDARAILEGRQAMDGLRDERIWGPPDRLLELVAWNISTRYLAIFVDGAIGILMLPFNVSHLGRAAYGLWALTASVTWFFNVLDLGYGSALVKFIAQYRAWRDHRALNEVVSTVATVFGGLGALCLVVTAVIAWRIDHFFHLDPDQAHTARQLLCIIGAYLAIQFPISVYGGVVYGFQRYYRNNLVGICTSLSVAAVNVVVLGTGHSLVTLVAATSAVRILSLVALVWQAYRAFPGLHVRPGLFRRDRLREVTGFSIYMAVLDWSAKLNYSSDTIVIGATLNTTAVAVWTVGQRLTQLAQQLTNQLSAALFPAVVDSDAAQRQDHLRMILLHGTKLSLALAAPLCVGLIVVAGPLIERWVGPQFAASVLPAQIMLTIVLVRNATVSATLILKGAGEHRLLTVTNATTAVVNVLLSIALVRPLGLLGIALGTLIPVAASGLFVLYPAACRRVHMPLRIPLTQAIWPALWPAIIMIFVLRFLQRFPARNLFEVAIPLGIGGVVYLALFVGLAIGADERQFYWGKIRAVFARRRRVPAAA